MQQILLFILLGLGSGALIAGIALAVVLTYRGSGSINLSTGAIAMLGGYAFWALNAGKLATLPTAVALPLSLLFVLAVGAITEFAVYRPLRNSSPLAKLVSSLGVLLIAQSAMILAFGVTPQPEPGILQPASHIFGAVVPVNRFILTGLVIAAAAGLGRAVQVDPLRARHPGGVGERGRGDASPVAEHHLRHGAVHHHAGQRVGHAERGEQDVRHPRSGPCRSSRHWPPR